MAIDNIIAAGIQPATPLMSPMQTMGGLMQLRGQMADQALRAAQVQEVNQRRQLVEAEQTQKNRDLTDQNLLTAKEQDAEFMKRLYGGDLSMLSGLGLQDKTIQAMNTHINDTISKKATTDTAKLANQRTASTEIGTSLDSLTQMRLPDGTLDVVRVNESLPDLVRRLSPQLAVLGVDPNTVPTTITDESQLMTIAAKNNALQALITSANARKEQQAKTGEQAALAKKNTTETEKAQFELDLMKGAANGGQDAAIRKRFGTNTEAAQAAIDAYNANLPAGLTAATQAVNKIYDERIGGAAKIASETAAHVAQQALLLPGKVKEATSVAYAQIAPHIKQAVDTQLELAKSSGEAFASVTDPTERHRAEASMEKSSLEYADKVSESRTLTSLIDAAQKGNKAAPAVIGLQELRGFVNRVNTTELKAVGSQAGSLKDQVEGWLRGKTEGQPIPPEILKATRELANLQEKAARSNYENKILITNSTYGSKVKPIDLPGGLVAPIELKDGTTLNPHDQASADAFRKEHSDLIK